MNEADRKDEGWRQIEAGLALIRWSKLVQWDDDHLAFIAASREAFESQEGHQVAHPTFGRLICWIVFSAGAEYLAKGVCFLKGEDFTKAISVIRIPSLGEDLETWVREVFAHARSVKEKTVSFETLSKIPLRSALQDVPERAFVVAAFELLRSTIRNRDAHRYTQNVRAFHFYLIEILFVPAFNILLRNVDQNELRVRVVATGRSSDSPPNTPLQPTSGAGSGN